MKFILTLLFSLGAFAQYIPRDVDPGMSGTISGGSGTIGFTTIQNSFKFGVETILTPSGTVTSPVASLQVSDDCVNFQADPLAATGDARKSFTYSGTVGGNYYGFMEDTELSSNCVRVFYTYSGGGTIAIKEIRKSRGSQK